MTLIIKGALTDLNTYINAERSNRFMAAKIKKQNTQVVYIEAIRQHVPKFKKSVFIAYKWYCKNKKKDKSNVAFSKKFVEDGLILAKVLTNDGWDQIEGWSDDFYIDAKNPRVEVDIVSI